MIISFDIMNENDYKKYSLTPLLALCLVAFPFMQPTFYLYYLILVSDTYTYNTVLAER